MPTINQGDIIKNPHRDKKDTVQASYIPEHVRLGRNPVVQGFLSLDGEMIETDHTDSHTIDNNEHVNYMPNSSVNRTVRQTTNSPNIGEFVLMVSGKVVSHGGHEQILAEAKSILYGQHEKYTKQQVSLEDIIILKRVGLKVGVFLDE